MQEYLTVRHLLAHVHKGTKKPQWSLWPPFLEPPVYSCREETTTCLHLVSFVSSSCMQWQMLSFWSCMCGVNSLTQTSKTPARFLSSFNFNQLREMVRLYEVSVSDGWNAQWPFFATSPDGQRSQKVERCGTEAGGHEREYEDNVHQKYKKRPRGRKGGQESAIANESSLLFSQLFFPVLRAALHTRPEALDMLHGPSFSLKAVGIRNECTSKITSLCLTWSLIVTMVTQKTTGLAWDFGPLGLFLCFSSTWVLCQVVEAHIGVGWMRNSNL